MLHELIYFSKAVKGIDEAGVTDILVTARDRNAEKDITGLLVMNGDEFIQILEGEKNEIFSLLEKIKKDD